MQRIRYIEGMRGLMALNVILCHFVCVYFPQMYFPGYDSPLSIFVSTPLSGLVNGNIAVMFFFALTGFLVGRSVFTKDAQIACVEPKLLQRYLRLLPVVLYTTVFVFLTMKLGLQFHLDITNENVATSHLQQYCNFDATIGSLLSHSFFWPFVDYSKYVGPFWTIHYELWGYMIVLVTAIALKQSRWRRLTYLVVIFMLLFALDAYWCVFVMGLLVADLLYNDAPTVLGRFYKRLLSNRAFLAGCLVVATYLACCPMQEQVPLYSFWYRLPMIDHYLLRGAGMALFLLVAEQTGWIQRLLSWRPLVLFGERSFAVYAIHWPLMLSCQSGLFLLLEERMPYDGAALLAFLITLPVIGLCAALLHMLADRTSGRINQMMEKIRIRTAENANQE